MPFKPGDPHPTELYCTKHKKMEPYDKFYDNPRGKYGKSSWCKQGMKSRNKRLRYQVKRYDSPETLARRAVQNALKQGTIIKPKRCPHFGVATIECLEGERLEFHHTGSDEIPDPYDPRNWLLGTWACHVHHTIIEGKSKLPANMLAINPPSPRPAVTPRQHPKLK